MILTSSFRAYASREEQNQKNLSRSALEFHTGPSYAPPLSFFTVLKTPIFLERMHKTMRGLTVTDTHNRRKLSDDSQKGITVRAMNR